MTGDSQQAAMHLDKTVAVRKQDFATMSHAIITKDSGKSDSITEFNAGVSVSKLLHC